MIKKLFWFFTGFIIISIIYFVFIYLLGTAMEALDISLYDSESDQQRNFNIVMLLWLLIASIGGWVIAKRRSS